MIRVVHRVDRYAKRHRLFVHRLVDLRRVRRGDDQAVALRDPSTERDVDRLVVLVDGASAELAVEQVVEGLLVVPRVLGLGAREARR